MSQAFEQEKYVYQSIADPKLQAKVFTNWSPTDYYVGALMALIVIAATVWLGSTSALALMVIALVMLARTPHAYGRVYAELKTDFKSWYINKILGGVLWSAEPVGNRLVRWLRALHRALQPAIPLNLARIVTQVGGVRESIGLLRQTDGHYDYLIISSEGGTFSTLDVNDEAHSVNVLAATINDVVLQAESLDVGVSFNRVTSPSDRTEFQDDLQYNLNPLVAYPDRFDLDDDTRAWAEEGEPYLDELWNEMVSLGATKNRYLIILTIKSKIPRKEKKRSILTDKQLYEQPIVELGRSLVSALQEATLLGLKNTHCLGMAELALLVRESWDVTGIQEYRAARKRGEIPKTDEEIDTFLLTHEVSELNAYLRAWPERIISVSPTKHCTRMDDNYLTNLRVVRTPEKIRADQYRELHYKVPAGIWLRRAMVGQAVSGTAQTNQLVVSQSTFLNLRGAFNQNDIVEHPKIRKRRQQLEAAAEEMEGSVIAQHYNQLLTIVASSEDLAVSQRGIVKGKYASVGFITKPVPDSARQIDAIVGGILGINRL